MHMAMSAKCTTATRRITGHDAAAGAMIAIGPGRRALILQIAAALACGAVCAETRAPSTLAAGKVDAIGKSKTNIVDIVSFGAKGDGKSDDQAAIQRAFDYAKANGKDVLIPEGIFI